MNERIQKYIKTQCQNCKNKDSDLCEISVFDADNVITTKCVYYEREN